MIFDTLQNAKQYFPLGQSYEMAFAFITRAVKEDLPIGKYELDGDSVYAMVQEYNTKEEADARFEGHQKYIDLQYILSGTEVMQAINLANATVEIPYDVEKDLAFYQNAENATTAILSAQAFAIFFPHDIHRPGMALNNIPSRVKKIVVKIKV
jgi:YhcH/YjgK/YiaL family protein